jgi:hypothetical protein
MEDCELAVANLRVRITMLQRSERRCLDLLSDNSQSASVHNEARLQLHKVFSEMVAAAAIRELESEPPK